MPPPNFNILPFHLKDDVIKETNFYITCISTGNTAAFSAVHGKDVWEYAETNPEHSKLINDAMACHARVAIRAIIDNCPEIFKGIETLVDVGGGDGTTISLLVKTFPWIRGINFDLPHVVSVALPCHGVRHVEGNMFDSIPKADAAFLMVSRANREFTFYFHNRYT